MRILSRNVVGIVMSKSWECTLLGAVVIGVSISSSVKVWLNIVVGVKWSEKPVERTLLALLTAMNLLVCLVALFEYLLVDGVIIDIIRFNHGSLLFEIWSRVPLIGHGVLVAHVLGESITGDEAGCQWVSSEESPCGSCWMNVWVVLDPSLIWNNCDTTLVSLSSLSDENSKWPSKKGAECEVPAKFSPIFLFQLSHVFEWHTLWVCHVLLKSRR